MCFDVYSFFFMYNESPVATIILIKPNGHVSVWIMHECVNTLSPRMRRMD